ncbi:TPA: hypothetical protein IAD52_03870 [Candidatus Spyradomonas excrementavium]|nr:hypothetical protein [Candidatus Spyradomonas excrementavium]
MINSIQPKLHINNKTQNKQNFKGGVELLSTGLNLLNTNPALGAVFVDVAFMDSPRTIVDTTRNPDAGLETATREFSSTLNHAAAGLVGIGAGSLVANAFNKANGVKAHMIFTNGESIDLFSKFEAAARTAKNPKMAYYESILSSIEGLNSLAKPDAPYTNKLQPETVTEAAKLLSEAKTDKYGLPKDVYAKVNALITGDIGAAESIKVTNGEQVVEGRLENFLKDAFSIKKAYIDKAEHDAKDGVKKLTDAEFVKALKNIKIRTAAAGLAVPVAIGMSLQPLNAYLTKKRTGNGGFVGGGEPDHSFGFKALKTAVGTGIAAAMLSTVAKKFSDIPSAIQYKGLVPTIPQFKLIYACTIFSRMLAARNKDELRESTIKDSLGFVNWLILGGFVSKLALNKMDKTLINYDEKSMGKGGWNWITKAVEKSHEEILYPALQEFKISTIGEDGKALSYGKLMKALKEKAQGTERLAEVLKQIKCKNKAQLLGYLYSGVVLGVGIPKLNIAITKHVNQKREAKKALNAQNSPQPMQIQNIVPENKTFASFLGAKQA